MATMNASLPDRMKDWVEQQSESGRYANSSDYIRDLIRRDQIKTEKIAHWQRLIDEGRAGGVSPRSLGDIFAEARRIAGLPGRA